MIITCHKWDYIHYFLRLSLCGIGCKWIEVFLEEWSQNESFGKMNYETTEGEPLLGFAVIYSLWQQSTWRWMAALRFLNENCYKARNTCKCFVVHDKNIASCLYFPLCDLIFNERTWNIHHIFNLFLVILVMWACGIFHPQGFCKCEINQPDWS